MGKGLSLTTSSILLSSSKNYTTPLPNNRNKMQQVGASRPLGFEGMG
jgi:hypothetical protein